MYQDLAKNSMMFQSYVQLTMMQNHIQKPSSANINLKVLDRSLFSAKYSFIKHAREHGNLSDAEYEVITDWFDYLTRRFAAGSASRSGRLRSNLAGSRLEPC